MFNSVQATNLVVDSGAIIQGAKLETLGKELWTINEVLEEIRDPKARAFIESLPVPIKVRQPTPQDVKAGMSHATN
jgi:RNA-binding protein NOB1